MLYLFAHSFNPLSGSGPPANGAHPGVLNLQLVHQALNLVLHSVSGIGDFRTYRYTKYVIISMAIMHSITFTIVSVAIPLLIKITKIDRKVIRE